MEGVTFMKKITLALVTALALASQVTPAQAATKAYTKKGDVDRVSQELFAKNIKSKNDKSRLVYVNRDLYRSLKKANKWKTLKGIQNMQQWARDNYGKEAAKLVVTKCTFKEMKVGKKTSYKITLTISDDRAREYYKAHKPAATPKPTQQPAQDQTQDQPSTPVYEETNLECNVGVEEAKKIVAEVRERINDYERLFNCTANDFEKASIIAGWVDEHMSYCAQGDLPEDRGDYFDKTALGDCTAFAHLNCDIAEYFDLDVQRCQKPGHIWNILTVDGVRYEYDATDAGRSGMTFEEISHGDYAKYNVAEFGGTVANITEEECRQGSYYYAKMNYTRDYAKRDFYVKGIYYSCQKVYWVTDLSKEKGFFYNELTRTKYYYKDYDRVTQVLEKISDSEIQRYYEAWINSPD